MTIEPLDTTHPTVANLRDAAKYGPKPGTIAKGLRGWWTPDGFYVCAKCASRILGRGCQLPRGSEPAWEDKQDPYGVCCVCVD